MRSDDQSLHMYQNTDNVVQLSSEELFKMLEPSEFSYGWESCCKRPFFISQSVQFYSHHLFGLSSTLRLNIFCPQVAEAAVSFLSGERVRFEEPLTCHSC